MFFYRDQHKFKSAKAICNTTNVKKMMLSQSLLGEVLQQNELSSAFIEKHLQHRLELLSVKKDELIQRPNEVCKKIYFIESGCLRTFTSLNGQERTVDFTCTGHFYTLAESFAKQQKSAFGLRCESHCQLYVLHYYDLRLLCDEVLEFVQLSNQIVGERFLQLQEQLLLERYGSASERFAALCQRCPEVIKYAQRKHLASYLGIAPPSFTRLLKAHVAPKDISPR